ncbi:general substrate transporter [Aspergillus pseudoustus]|uniref:General substrate transporter n=1 Tax=Aspergillus pseudoustus TaxID=1810923 RepID=A0ABR4KUN8_9EURO
MGTYNSYFLLNTPATALNTSSTYTSSAITITGAVLQAASVHIALLIFGRIVIGMGMAVAATATPMFVAEISKPSYRAFASAVYYACWQVGALLATGVCYGTNDWTSNWTWRFPSLFQVVPSVFAGVVVCIVPESPR